MEPGPSPPVAATGRDAAEAAGLTYASVETPGFTRRRAGKGFFYKDAQGGRVSDGATLQRIRALAIPSAWTSVWICSDPNGHIQAIGQDAKGRRQYHYHPRFRDVRDGAKFEHTLAFAEALPQLRSQVAEDMAARGLGRQKVVATVVHLLETTMIRVGNAAYAKQNRSYGLTTLRVRHVTVNGSDLRFAFKGKSGRVWNVSVHDRRVARIVRTCQELPGQHLFQYLDADGGRQLVTSADVNAYLKTASGADITAKDFRTWAGTVLAAVALSEFAAEDRSAPTKIGIARAIAHVSACLGNTPTICRKCYVHPDILQAYLDGDLPPDLAEYVGEGQDDEPRTLRPEESAVLGILSERLSGATTASAVGATVAPKTRTGRSQTRPATTARQAPDLRRGA